MSIENLASSIPEFKYIPRAINLDQVAKSVALGDLDLEKETAEIAHLKFDLGLDTVKLFSDLKNLQLNNEVRDEISTVIGLVAVSEREPDVQQTLLEQIELMPISEAKRLIEISLKIKNANKKNQN